MTRILGVGNPLMSDDGVGIAVVEQLWREPLLEDVEVVDAGTGGLDLIHLIAEAEAALLIDAVDMGAEPGTLRWLTPEEVKQDGAPLRLSLHETRLGPLLQWLELLGNCPPVSILGIQPASIQPGMGLSRSVKQAVPQAVRQIREWIASSHTPSANSANLSQLSQP